jgi:hypothetical protein
MQNEQRWSLTVQQSFQIKNLCDTNEQLLHAFSSKSTLDLNVMYQNLKDNILVRFNGHGFQRKYVKYMYL